MFKKIGVSVMVAVAACTIVACSDGDDGNPSVGAPVTPPATKALGITAAKGAIKGATCNVFNLPRTASSTSIGSGVTSSVDGTLNVAILASAGAIIVECTGGVYFNEALTPPADVPVGSEVVKAVVPSGVAAIGVTPLTSIAAEVLNDRLASLTPQQLATPGVLNANVNQSNMDVADALVPGINLLTPPTIINSATPNLGSGSADVYAVYLASLARLAAANPGVDSFDLVRDIVSDIRADGSVNGVLQGGASSQSYSSFTNLTSNLDAQAMDYANDTGNSDTAAAAEETADEPNQGSVPTTGNGTGS